MFDQLLLCLTPASSSGSKLALLDISPTLTQASAVGISPKISSATEVKVT
jgi:hypothetical protein